MNNMNFAMYTGFYDVVLRDGIEKAADYAKGLGFSSVEFFASTAVGRPNPVPDIESAKRAREALKQKGLSVACYSVYANVWKDEESIRRMLELVDIAHELGSPFFHHTLLPKRALIEESVECDEAISAAVDAAERIANYAEPLGITCIYEDQGYYVNGVESFGIFWKEIKKRCRNVGICGDVGNILFVNETPEAFFEAYIHDICHVHIKDYLRKQAPVSPGKYWAHAVDDIWLRDTMVGSGVVDFEACMKLLKEVGYKGAFSLENGHPEPYEEGVAQAMEYLVRYW